MADNEEAREEGGKKKKKKQLTPEQLAQRPVRVFEMPRVQLVRMGRVVGTYRAAYATVDASRGAIEFTRVTAEVAEARLSADRVRLSMGANRIAASGNVRVEEKNLKLRGERLLATPSLTGIRLAGKVSLRTDNPEAAEALLTSIRD